MDIWSIWPNPHSNPCGGHFSCPQFADGRQLHREISGLPRVTEPAFKPRHLGLSPCDRRPLPAVDRCQGGLGLLCQFSRGRWGVAEGTGEGGGHCRSAVLLKNITERWAPLGIPWGSVERLGPGLCPTVSLCPRPELWNSQPFTTLSALDTPTECLESLSLTFPLARRILSTLNLV